jgi:hypothetical protein
LIIYLQHIDPDCRADNCRLAQFLHQALFDPRFFNLWDGFRRFSLSSIGGGLHE